MRSILRRWLSGSRKPLATWRASSIRPLPASVPPLFAAPGGDVAQERVAPLVQGSAEAGDFGDRAGGERGEDLLGDPSPGDVVWLVVDGSELLGAVPGDLDLVVALVSDEGRVQAGVLSVGEVLDAGAQDVADPVEGVVFAAAVAVDVLLDPAPDLVDRGLRA